MIELYTAATGNGRRALIMMEESGLAYSGPGGRVVLRQSAAILFYLAEKSDRLLPRDGAARAATLEWTMFAMTDVVGANTAMYLTLTEFPQAEAPAGYFRDKLVELLQVCDRRLRESDYLAGAEMTLADLALFPVLLSRRAIVDATAGLDHFKRWGERIGARPAIQRALAKENEP
ncbi:MAG: glutathione S-transferase family protein [Betaproteobacteria bacterium]